MPGYKTHAHNIHTHVQDREIFAARSSHENVSVLFAMAKKVVSLATTKGSEISHDEITFLSMQHLYLRNNITQTAERCGCIHV